jgi:phage shock protein PspC (stress-responsive transcriptional regulator)
VFHFHWQRKIQKNPARGCDMCEKNWLQRFTKSQTDKWIGGVCGGLGEYTPIPPWCWRFLFAFLFFFCGFGLLLYILLWIFVPKGNKG